MNVAIGCDHRGFSLKQKVMAYLHDLSHDCQDYGCYNTDSVDYPDIAKKVSEGVSSCSSEKGILICGTGLGMSIAANKLKGIRAALCYDALAASKARKHNDANILCLKGEDIETGTTLDIVRIFLSTNFEGGRHIQRINKITTLETS
jgi:ribose 5-phosphate isomerase B